MTDMLQHLSKTLSLLVLAVAGPGVALAEAPAALVASSGVSSDSVTSSSRASAILDEVNASRSQMALAPLDTHLSLADVAEAHARDMAVKGYVSYTDETGTCLLSKVRKEDRRALISSFATTIAVLPAGATPAEIQAAILSDAANAENLGRSFSHAGVGTWEADDRLYVVQLFARIDGELGQALPVQVAGSALIQPALASDSMKPVGWSLSSADGEYVARGSGRLVQTTSGAPLEGYLNVDVAVGPDIYTLKGPYVQVN